MLRYRDAGFTLIELLLVTLIVGVLASMAAPQLQEMRERAYDAAALSDLRNAVPFIELYQQNSYQLPRRWTDIQPLGFSISDDIRFSRWSRSTGGRQGPRIHMHAEHAASTNYFHWTYPTEAQPIVQRKGRGR